MNIYSGTSPEYRKNSFNALNSQGTSLSIGGGVDSSISKAGTAFSMGTSAVGGKQEGIQLNNSLAEILALLKSISEQLNKMLAGLPLISQTEPAGRSAHLSAPQAGFSSSLNDVVKLAKTEQQPSVKPQSERSIEPDGDIDPFDELDFADGTKGSAGIELRDYELKRIWSEVGHEKNWKVELSGKNKGERPRDLKNGVSWQYKPYPWLGGDSRVPYLEVIKLAMLKYGQSVDSVLAKVTPVPGGYDIVMKDGFKLNITDKELHLASKACGFVGLDDGLVGDASFLFGVMCKRRYLCKQLTDPVDDERWSRVLTANDKQMRTYSGVLACSSSTKDKQILLHELGLSCEVTPQELAKGPREPRIRQLNRF